MAIESLVLTTAKLPLLDILSPRKLKMHSAYVATDEIGGNEQKTRRMRASHGRYIKSRSPPELFKHQFSLLENNRHEPQNSFQHSLSVTRLSALCPAGLRPSLGLASTSPEQLQYQRAPGRGKLLPANL